MRAYKIQTFLPCSRDNYIRRKRRVEIHPVPCTRWFSISLANKSCRREFFFFTLILGSYFKLVERYIHQRFVNHDWLRGFPSTKFRFLFFGVDIYKGIDDCPHFQIFSLLFAPLDIVVANCEYISTMDIRSVFEACSHFIVIVRVLMVLYALSLTTVSIEKNETSFFYEKTIDLHYTYVDWQTLTSKN